MSDGSSAVQVAGMLTQKQYVVARAASVVVVVAVAAEMPA